MVKLWVTQDKQLGIKCTGTSKSTIYSDLVSLSEVDKESTYFVTDLVNTKFIVSFLESQYPNTQVTKSKIVDKLLSRPTVKEYITTVDNLPVESFDLSENIELYDFQKVGGNYLVHTRRCLLCDSVGLGKSAQSIAAANYIINQQENLADYKQSVLIVCPPQLERKWKEEVEKFTGEKAVVISNRFTTTNLTPAYRNRIPLYKKDAKYKIISYDMLRTDKRFAAQYLTPISVLIMDEIQYVKNHMTKRFKALVGIAAQSDYFFGLSATPIESGAIELYNIMKFVNPDVFGHRQSFYNRYVCYGFFREITGYKNVEDLQRKTEQFILRRHKEEVSDNMPSVVENNYYIDLTKRQKEMYKNLKNRALDAFVKYDEDELLTLDSYELIEKLDNDHPIVLLHLLRQVCLSSQLIDPQTEYSSKLNTLLEIIESLGDSKVVIFCFYKKMVEIISDFLYNNGVENLWVHGGTKDKLNDVLDKFTPESNYKALVTSDILKEGHDLLTANYVVNFDIPLSGTVYIQRCGRVDRIGQARDTVYMINMISEDTLEMKIYNALVDKMMFMKNIVSPDFVSSRITVNDLKHYIEDE